MWKGKDIWNFLRTMDVPVNSLHSKGYISIGCEPCTRPVLPGQHEREGRWWWEDAKAKECGLHKGNITNVVGADVNGASTAVVNGVGDIFKSPTIFNLSRPGIQNLLKLENRSEPWLVVLYAPWCQFCQGMEASYIELAEKLSGSGVKVAKFQADGEQKSFAKQELQLGSFPTILFFPKHASRPISIHLSGGMLILCLLSLMHSDEVQVEEKKGGFVLGRDRWKQARMINSIVDYQFCCFNSEFEDVALIINQATFSGLQPGG